MGREIGNRGEEGQRVNGMELLMVAEVENGEWRVESGGGAGDSGGIVGGMQIRSAYR